MTGSFCDSFFLHFIQKCLCFLFDLCNSFIYLLRVFRIEDIQFFEHSCRIQFQVIVHGRIDQNYSVFFFLDQLTVYSKIHEMLLHIGGIHSQKLRRSLKEFFLRKINMSVTGCL